MDYHMVVLDLDGTLTNSEKKVTERTKKALTDYMEHGGTVVLASGRPTYGIIPLARELHLDTYGGYILSFNGGQIISCEKNEVIYQKELPSGVPKLLGEKAKEHDVGILTYEGDHIVTETPENIYAQKESFINKMPIQKIEDFSSYVNFPVTKCLMVADGDYLARVEEQLKMELGSRYSILRSEPYFLEIMPEGIDKAQSLERLLAHVGIERKEMAAFGDGFNDRSMLVYAGLGVAMGNAQEPVKEAADYIAPTNDEDGVAWVIEHMIMQEEASASNCSM
ncbi:MAG: Cof-type HAD-IIB family hydrolase [Lachnospiraceae bacterium]|nr:Cof-type HAD-IIB family hydrolase [Lachnospiraceae bacterium]